MKRGLRKNLSLFYLLQIFADVLHNPFFNLIELNMYINELSFFHYSFFDQSIRFIMSQ